MENTQGLSGRFQRWIAFSALLLFLSGAVVLFVFWLEQPVIGEASYVHSVKSQAQEVQRLKAAERKIAQDLTAGFPNRDSVQRMRAAVVKDLWPSTGQLPRGLPTKVEDHSAGTPHDGWPLPEVQRLARTQRIAITDRLAETDSAFVNYAYRFMVEEHPGRLNRLVIVHQGHGEPGSNLVDETVAQFLVNGFDVLYCGMPLVGGNAGPDVHHQAAVVQGCVHDCFGHLERPGFNPLSLLLNQLPTAIDTAIQLNGDSYDDLTMIGISGGGYTTTLYAAVDVRINTSISVAGTMPHELRNQGDWGWEDAEQQSIFSICTFPQIYVLCSTSEQNNVRRHFQFYNMHDAVFGAIDGRYSHYVDHVARKAAELGGYFGCFIDAYSDRHHITSSMRKQLLTILSSASMEAED